MPTIISSGVLRLAGFDRVRMPSGGVYVFPITSCWPCAPFCYSPPSRYRSIRAIFAYWFVFHLSDRPFSPLCDSNKVRYCEIWCHFLHSFLSVFAHLLCPSCTMGSIVEVFVCGFDWYALNQFCIYWPIANLSIFNYSLIVNSPWLADYRWRYDIFVTHDPHLAGICI